MLAALVLDATFIYLKILMYLTTKNIEIVGISLVFLHSLIVILYRGYSIHNLLSNDYSLIVHRVYYHRLIRLCR